MTLERGAADEAVSEVSKLLRHHDGADPLLVAVGGCGSVRAAVASVVAESLKATLIDLRDFRRPMDTGRRAALDPQSAYELVDDWQRLTAEVLDPLLVGEAGAYRRFDRDADQVGEDLRVIEPHGAVVVEGPFVLRPQLRGYWDIAVHVSAAPESDAERWYLDNVGPEQAADVVVPLSR